MLRFWGVWLACLLCSGTTARAQSPGDEQRLVLMREPLSYTDVIDAADEHDRFDLNAYIYYLRSVDRGTIQREHTTASGRRSRAAVADSERVLSQLSLGLEVGLYRDLMAFVRLPLTVSDARSLRRPRQGAAALLDDPGAADGGAGPLFSLPFTSPTRAGFDYVAFGVAYGLLSQERARHMPNWVLSLEGRRAVGTPMRPCRLNDEGRRQCGTASAADLDGDGQLDGTRAGFGDAGAGLSRGVSGILFETRLSRRFRYAEPYVGLGALFEWPSTGRKYFRPGGEVDGMLQQSPSRQFSADIGGAWIPWEHRGRFQRVAIDGRLHATYYSGGREYSALYDALGSSSHPQLARPEFEGIVGDISPGAALAPCGEGGERPCYVGSQVPFYGLTDVGSRLRYGARLGLELQAARYVRFQFGSALSWITSHPLTAAQSCHREIDDAERSASLGGTQCADGIVNPAHRGTIDLPGRRFWMVGEMVFDIYAVATAQF